ASLAVTYELEQAGTLLFSEASEDGDTHQPWTQFEHFPGSRYMGSKNRILPAIWDHLKVLQFESFLDAFAGSNVVSYFMRCHNKRVITNDFLRFSFTISKAIIENSEDTLDN